MDTKPRPGQTETVKLILMAVLGWYAVFRVGIEGFDHQLMPGGGTGAGSDVKDTFVTLRHLVGL